MFIAYSFTKINGLPLNSFKKIKCNYGKTNKCITSELYYYRVKTYYRLKTQETSSVLYRKYCSIHAQRKYLYGITVSLDAFSGVSSKNITVTMRIEPGNFRPANNHARRSAIASVLGVCFFDVLWCLWSGRWLTLKGMANTRYINIHNRFMIEWNSFELRSWLSQCCQYQVVTESNWLNFLSIWMIKQIGRRKLKRGGESGKTGQCQFIKLYFREVWLDRYIHNK